MTRPVRPFAVLALLALLPTTIASPALARSEAQWLPLLSRLLAGPVQSLGAEEADSLAAKGDAALREGDAVAADQAWKAALAALPADAPPCTVRGALLYGRIVAQGRGASTDDDDPAEALAATCTKADVPDAERPMAGFLRALTFAEANRAGAGSPAERPDAWVDQQAIMAWRVEATKATEGAGGDRAALIAALADEAVALAGEPSGPCDTAGAKALRDQAEAARRRIEAAGRRDLTVSARARAALRDDGSIDRAKVQALADELTAPEAAWLGASGLSAAIGSLGTATMLQADPGALAPLCTALYDRLAAAIRADTAEGWQDRNVDRLTSAFGSSLSCPGRARLDGLVDDVLARAARSEDPGKGVLAVLVGAGANLAQAAITGRMDQAFAAADTLVRGLDRVREQLGDAPDDEALKATLTALVGVVRLLQTGDQAAVGQVAGAAKALAGVGRPKGSEAVPEDAPLVVRLGPGLHMGALGLLALVQSIQGDADAAEATLATLDQSLEKDAEALLRNLGAGENTEALVRTLKAARAVIEAAVADATPEAIDAATAAVRAAMAPGTGEQGWWAIGLDGGRLVLLDVLALMAADTSADKARALLADAQTVAQRLVDTALDTFEVRGTGWELLSAVPPIHAVIGRTLGADLTTEQTAKLVIEAVDAPVREALGRLASSVRAPDTQTGAQAGARPLGYLDLTIDALEMATEIGAMRFADATTEAMAELGARLLDRAAAYPPDLRGYAELTAGALLWSKDAAKGAAALDRAASTLGGSRMARYAWLPLLAKARLAAADDDAKAALAATDAALAVGVEAHQCGKHHAVDGLLPYRMVALEALGRHDEARAAWRTWSELLDQGFTGDGTIQCQMMSYRGNVAANANIAHQPGAMMLPSGTNDGTFQVGLGFQSPERDHDRIVCAAGPLATRRSDRIAGIHLAAALYALHAGRDDEAHASLLDAWSELRLVAYGSPGTLGRMAGGAANEARDKVPLRTVAWVTTAARLRGHVHLAARIEEVAQLVAGVRGTTLAEAVQADDGLPELIEEAEFAAALEPAVRAWFATSEEDDVDAAERALAKAAKDTKLGPQWGVKAAVQVLRASVGDLKGAAKELAALKAPKDATGKAVVDGLDTLLGQVAGGAADGKALGAAVDALTKAGLDGEAMGVAQQGAAMLLSQQDRAGAIALLERAVAAIPADRAPLARADMLATLGEGYIADGRLDEAAKALATMWGALHGRIPPDQELQQRMAYVNMLGGTRRWDELEARLEELVPVLGPTFGWANPTVYRLRATQVALHALRGEVDPGRIDATLAWADEAQGADDATALLHALRDGADPAARKARAEQFLAGVFGGYAP